jgi:hypothetical protein
MSDSRHFRSQNHGEQEQLNFQLFPTNLIRPLYLVPVQQQMPYNDYYNLSSQANPNGESTYDFSKFENEIACKRSLEKFCLF